MTDLLSSQEDVPRASANFVETFGLLAKST